MAKKQTKTTKPKEVDNSQNLWKELEERIVQIVSGMDEKLNGRFDKIDEVLNGKIQPKKDKVQMDIKELLCLMNDEYGFFWNAHTVYVLTSPKRKTRKDKRYSYGKFINYTRDLPFTKQGKKLSFETKEIRAWAEEQIKHSRVIVPS